MQVLSAQQASLAFGGDNPGMGPYAPPMNAEMQAAYMNAAKMLTGAVPWVGGTIEFKLQQDLAARSAAWNLANGYNAAGTQYQWPSGVWSSVQVSQSTQSEMGAAMATQSADELIQCIVDQGPGASLDQILDNCYDDVSSYDTWDYYVYDDSGNGSY